MIALGIESPLFEREMFKESTLDVKALIVNDSMLQIVSEGGRECILLLYVLCGVVVFRWLTMRSPNAYLDVRLIKCQVHTYFESTSNS